MLRVSDLVFYFITQKQFTVKSKLEYRLELVDSRHDLYGRLMVIKPFIPFENHHKKEIVKRKER